ncbi:MAG: hypothetical protein Q7T91_01340 [Sulfuricurvum sp.]|nr:hypothetical protein [Sulfuricurvum sp.]
MNILTVYDVFTPSTIAKKNYIERTLINGRIASALTTPGKQIVIFGYSGVGKSSLLRKSLEKFYEREIITHCMKGMTFESVVLDAFDRLNEFYIDSVSNKTVKGIKANIQQDYKAIKASLEVSRQQENSETLKRMVNTQLTPQRLADFLGEGQYCWILEDFHKMDESEKVKLSQIMKVFMDKSVDYKNLKIIALGAVNTGREVVEYDSEMRNRVSEIEVTLMSEKELLGIIENGEKLLNIHFPEDLKKNIASFSNGLASVCHAICLYICEEKGILETIKGETVKVGTKELNKALHRYIEEQSDSIKDKFDKALKQRDTKFKNTELIMTALAKFPADGATYSQLLKTVLDQRNDYPQGNLTIYLTQLQSSDKGQLIKYDTASGKYSFSEPIYIPYIIARFQDNRSEKESINSISNKIGQLAYKILVDEIMKRYQIN